MKAAALLGPNRVEIRETPVPPLSEHDVLIQPTRAGICGSDVSLYVGHRQPPHLPFTIGHEVVGRIVAIGPAVTGLSPGQRVIVEPNYVCGTCRFCLSGRGNICPNKKSMGVNVIGCFAEYTLAPDAFVWPIPDGVSDADAACIEPLAVALHALAQSAVNPGETIAVVGCGVLGLLLVHVATQQGIKSIAHDRFDSKRDMAAGLGAKAGAADDVATSWQKEDVSAVFECAGVAATTELSIAAAPRGSKVLLLGLAHTPVSFLPLRLIREGVRIEPSLIYDHPADFEMAIQLVHDRLLSPSTIVTDVFPFELIPSALELAASGKAGKVHVQFG